MDAEPSRETGVVGGSARLALAFVVVGVLLPSCHEKKGTGPQTRSTGEAAALASSKVSARRTNRLKVREIQAEDGARFPYDIWDNDLGAPCQFSLGRDGRVRCYPHVAERNARPLYRDPECKVPVLEICIWGEKVPRITAWRPAERNFGHPPERPADYAYGVVGPRVEWPKELYVSGGRCVAEPIRQPSAECHLFAIGKVLKAEDFAMGTYVTETLAP